MPDIPCPPLCLEQGGGFSPETRDKTGGRSNGRFSAVMKRRPGAITFRVDNVGNGAETFETMSALRRLQDQVSRPLWAVSHAPSFQVVKDQGHHPLISAVHLAFSQHLPLALTPDALWITIAQGFAQHVNNHADALRSTIVGRDSKLTIFVETDALNCPEDWARVVERWAHGIETHITPDLQDLLTCNFSTTTPISRTASQIVMMDAFRQYFDFHVRYVCGIPYITLHGTVEDWQSIHDRVQRLARYNLSWWTDRLLPLCDGFIATAEGQPSRRFWQEIYSPKHAYGGDKITGWLTDLFPYIKAVVTEAPTIRNPLLSKPCSQRTSDDGLPAYCFSSGLSEAPFTLMTRDAMKRTMLMLGGYIGVTQDPQTGCLQPEVGWAVEEGDHFNQILETIIRNHKTSPPTPWNVKNLDRNVNSGGVPKELIQAWERFDRATLFTSTRHPWKFRRYRDYTRHDVSGAHHNVSCFLDLADGRSIGYANVLLKQPGYGLWEWDSEWWVVVGRPAVRSVEELGRRRKKRFLDNPIVIARGVVQFFERVLEAEGEYYFDRPDFTPDGDLLET